MFPIVALVVGCAIAGAVSYYCFSDGKSKSVYSSFRESVISFTANDTNRLLVRKENVEDSLLDEQKFTKLQK